MAKHLRVSAEIRSSQRTNVSRLVVMAAALCLGIGPAGAQLPPLAISPVPSSPVADGFTLALAGDLIYLRPMLATIAKQSPDLLKLLQGEDVTFGNFETSVIDLSSFSGSPQAESGGTWMIAPPAAVHDIAAMGFDIVSTANNHATDWGVEGLATTMRHLDEAGIAHAGSGRNLSTATSPRYVDTSRGRVGLVAATSTFSTMSRAADPLGEVPGRPGINAVRSTRSLLLSRANLAKLAEIAGTGVRDTVTLSGVEYKATDTAALFNTPSYQINKFDETRNALAVRQAHQNANLTLFSLHTHEPSNQSNAPADFTVPFAKAMLDSGADLFVGHGPHQLRGIEIYKGKPIFYSLGNFAMMNNSLDVAPSDMYDQYGVQPGVATTPELLQSRNAKLFSDPRFYEAVIAVLKYNGGRLREIRLNPIELGVQSTGAQRGVPKMADRVVGRRILERLQRLSSPYGTIIRLEGQVGIISLDVATAH